MSPSQTDPIVSLKNVQLSLKGNAGTINILKSITLQVGRGQAVALTGPSGSGKSSLLMVMAGLERATGGTVHLQGQDLGRMDEDQLAVFRRDHVGVVFQSFHLIPTLTALENVLVPLELAGQPNAPAQAMAQLDAVGLAHRTGHYPAQMSGGEQQRVALARAVAPGPSVLFADEPTGNLDASTGAKVMDLMFALQKDQGATLILATHDAALAARCDRVITLHDGQVGP